MILGSDQRYGRQEARAQAALGHDHPRPPRPRQGGDRGDVGPARPQGRHPRLRRPDKINAAYALGGPRLTVKTVKSCSQARPAVQDQPRRQRELRRLPQGRQLHRRRLRRHRPPLLQRQHGGGENYATIDVHPGYQKLMGKRRARLRPLPPRRQRPRARARASRTSCASCATRPARGGCSTTAARASSPARSPATPTPTRACARRRTSSRCSSSCCSPGQKPVREVRFRVDLTNDPVYLTASQAKLDKTADEFLNAKASTKPRADHARLGRGPQVGVGAQGASATSASDRARASRSRAREGEDQAIVGARRARFPFYFPTLRYTRLALRRHRAAASTRSRTSAASSTAPTGSWSPRASSASTTASRA